jgi:predicted small lipoprotein YifL
MKPTLLPAGILLTLFLAGCGQSGPLYIPGNPSTIHPPPEQSEQSVQDQQKAEDDKNKDKDADSQ